MDSQQCTIQCPNCQPIQCPINSQGLYLLPATNSNEAIERANQTRFAAAATELTEQQEITHAAIVEQSEHIRPAARSAATEGVSELPPRHSKQRNDTVQWDEDIEQANLARFTAAAEDQSEHTDSVPRWASSNQFAALATDDEEDEVANTDQRTEDLSEQSEQTNQPPTPRCSNVSRWASLSELPELLQSTRDDDEDSVDDFAIDCGTERFPLADSDPLASNAKIELLALVATAAAITHQTSSTPEELVAFAHAALGSPPLSTLETAMKKGYLPPFVGLSTVTLKKYPPSLEATTMGHMDNRRKNIQSTKPKANLAQEQDHFPDQPSDTKRTNMCFLAAAEPRHIVYSDQTGRLPQPSSSGNNYLLVAYDYDSNAILMRPIKNRTAEALTAGIQDIHNTLSKGGCQPKFHRMDNECPQQVKD
jgi:hypothetical protein